MKLTNEIWDKITSIEVSEDSQIKLNNIHPPDDCSIEQLFTSIYNSLPNVNSFFSVHPDDFVKLLFEKYQDLIVDFSVKTVSIPSRKMRNQKRFIFLLKPDMLIRIDRTVEFAYKKTQFDFINVMIEEMGHFKKRRPPRFKPSFELLTYSGSAIRTTSVEINIPKLSIKESYNDDFIEVDKKIKNWIKKKDTSGLLLLHGKPGTGKTSYLRHLMVKMRMNFIYIPAAMGHSLSSPHFTEFLADNNNSVIVIEDAEKLLLDRGNDQSSDVSAVLNFCDGLLSDAFNIKMICSFNMPHTKLDKALLRKGRVFGMYEFKALAAAKCTKVSAILGHNKLFSDPTVLTDVCNPEEVIMNGLQESSSSIGFSFGHLN